MNKIKGIFYNKSIISVEQFERGDLEILFETARRMEKLVGETGGNNVLTHKILTLLFYEPSSRTFGSFVSAMQRLGGAVIPLHGVKNTSVMKGESFDDTVRVFGNYSDILVLRHPDKGAAFKAAQVSYVPIINAGDGSGEHPTQALLDFFTISKRFSFKQKITVVMVGDLLYGRTVHSLAKLLALFPRIKQVFVAPEQLQLPTSIVSYLHHADVGFEQTTDFTGALKKADVVYMTRVQKERFSDIAEYNKVKDVYLLQEKHLRLLKSRTLIMHPLPRVNEIETAIDKDARAVYLREQMRNGLFIRMALLSLILGVKI